jgi:hypothetical protein
MKKVFLFFILFISSTIVAQVADDELTKGLIKEKEKEVKPPINLYKIYTLQQDSTFVDTSLTIQSEYKYNLLRKDNFVLHSY